MKSRLFAGKVARGDQDDVVMSTVSSLDFDVLVVGAGLSGIGAAYRLMTECPDKRLAIFESREAIGGTWDIFRYPGVRSDSDMFTLGYPFNPWVADKSIADGASILEYIRSTAKKFGIEEKIRFQHRIVSAAWSSDKACWTVGVEVGEDRKLKTYTTKFLYLCSGYYSYDAAYAPEFRGAEKYKGTIVHPQWWPEDLDYKGKKVVVIGSGATAMTLVPSLAKTAAHVTMLQRSPTYVAALPYEDVLGKFLRKIVSADTAYHVVRGKNVLLSLAIYQFCKRFPKQARALFRAQAKSNLPADFAIDPHFAPKYDPWDQRLCVIPEGDLFEALRNRSASIETDTIDTFTENGIKLASGKELEADIIVTATGLKMLAFGNVKLSVDSKEIAPKDAYVYKGLMLSGVPNMAWCVGYTNASWTLRADLSSRYVCRLLKLMDRKHYDRAMPQVSDKDVETRPLLDLSSGYVQRAAEHMPRQGTKAPWHLRQNYVIDFMTMALGRVDDPAMVFEKVGEATTPTKRESSTKQASPAI